MAAAVSRSITARLSISTGPEQRSRSRARRMLWENAWNGISSGSLSNRAGPSPSSPLRLRVRIGLAAAVHAGLLLCDVRKASSTARCAAWPPTRKFCNRCVTSEEFCAKAQSAKIERIVARTAIVVAESFARLAQRQNLAARLQFAHKGIAEFRDGCVAAAVGLRDTRQHSPRLGRVPIEHPAHGNRHVNGSSHYPSPWRLCAFA